MRSEGVGRALVGIWGIHSPVSSVLSPAANRHRRAGAGVGRARGRVDTVPTPRVSLGGGHCGRRRRRTGSQDAAGKAARTRPRGGGSVLKISDSLYPFLGLTGDLGRAPAVYEHERSVVTVVGEVSDKPSTSITDRAERILDLLRRRHGRHVIAVEHDPPGPRRAPAVLLASGSTTA